MKLKYKAMINEHTQEEKQHKIKKVCIQMLAKFAKVCNAHNLKWWVDGGTLLGAVRDGKMIPWDDDVDVTMPREDYDELCKLALQDVNLFGRYFFQTSSTDDYFEVHAKLRDPDTCALTERECTGMHNRGMFLDIFPLDNCPNDKNVRADIAGFTRTFAKHSGIEHNEKRMPDFCAFNRVLRLIHKQNKDSNYIANMAFWRYDKKLIVLKKEWYATTKLIEFEDVIVRIPGNAAAVLKAWYGKSWRTPKNEANCHKGYVDPFNSYKHYNGITKDEFEELVKSLK